MPTTATKTDHSSSAHTTHANSNSHSGTHSTAAKTTSKTSGKRRGGYSFSHSAGAGAKSAGAKKGTRGTGAKRKTSSVHSSKSHTSSAHGTGTGRTGKSKLDLGFASIAKSASDTARQNTATWNRAAGKTSNALNGTFANVASNAKQVQDKVSNYTRGLSDNLKQTASRAAENTNRSLEMHRANAEALGQSYNAAQSAMKEASQEIFQFFNNAFAQNVESARAALECRNIGEFFQIQNDRVKQNIESAVEQALRLSEIAIETATSAIEPLNASVTKNSKKFAQYNS